jgi:hypothetical protein
MARYGFLVCLFAAFALGADVRLTNDNSASGGYISAFTLATGTLYTDAVLQECTKARGRQNEPSVAVNPRDTRVLIGSSNDYCGVYAGSPDAGPFVASGPIWLGYYRSENSGASFQSSLVPGYPGDTSPYAALAAIRTASAGDPVIAWDAHGRVFMGSESSGDPAGSKKGFGDVWVARFANPAGESGNTLNDGKQYLGTSVVARGSSGQNFSGKFNDKTAIEADRSGSVCDGNVYFSWSRFNQFGSNIYFSRSTDHGATWSNPVLLTTNIGNVQDPDISVTGNGHVYVTFDLGATLSGQPNGAAIANSVDCGKTFSRPVVVTTYIPYNAQDTRTPQPVPAPVSAPDDPSFSEEASGGSARDCGDFADACQSGYTFFRRTTSTRSTADQFDAQHEWIYIVYDATKPGTEIATGTTYGSVAPGTGSQSGVYFVRLDGVTGAVTTPTLIDNQTNGHQVFPDISADGGVLRAIWWDSRSDPSYSPKRPIGNDAAGKTFPSLDVWAARSTDAGQTWTSKAALNTTTSNPNYEQFDNRAVPFAGDYLWVTSKGDFSFATWTDWRNTVAGTDPREPLATDGADVKQCRTFSVATNTWSSDQCPHEGGLDQDIFGAPAQ